MSRSEPIVTYYCAHGCNVMFTHGLYADKPTKRELEDVVCQKCGNKGFNRQNECGIDPNPDLTNLRREQALFDELKEVFHRHTLIGNGFLPVPEITTLPIGGEFAIHIKADERVRTLVGRDRTSPHHIQNCYATQISKEKRAASEKEAGDG